MRTYLILFLLILSNSCTVFPVPQKYKAAMHCFSGEYTGLDTLLKIHGYFSKMVITDKTGIYKYVDGEQIEIGIDTNYYEFMFFPDGIFIGDLGFQSMTIEEGLSNMVKKGIDFRDIRGYYQGTYKLNADTIKIQRITPGYGNTWGIREIWYKIINDSTLVDFHERHLVQTKGDRRIYPPRWYEDSTPSRFVYVDSIPESSTWLMNEDWFYCK